MTFTGGTKKLNPGSGALANGTTALQVAMKAFAAVPLLQTIPASVYSLSITPEGSILTANRGSRSFKNACTPNMASWSMPQ